MKYFLFIIGLIFSLALAFGLSRQWDTIPPLGSFLDPHHGFWQNSYSEDQKASKEYFIKGLSEEVQVVYDEHLIPHIFAQNSKDLFKAQGYITAKHRLWQMDFQTRAAAGRISEIVGPVALELDRMTRRKGLAYAAEVGLQHLKDNDQEVYQLVEAYSEGVNQYIEELRNADLPLEYKILNYKPESWSPYRSLLLLKYMADMLVGDRDLEFTNLRNALGQEMLDKLFPDFPKENDPVIEAERIWNFEAQKVEKPVDLEYPHQNIFIKTMPQPEPGTGSNNWAVSGSKTKSGHPILANDPHLNLNAPSLWYIVQLTTPEFSVKGATLPGALGVISGFNEHIAWGVTNATRDTRDWYAIQFKDETRAEYLYDRQWRKSEARIEEIKIKNQETYLDTVIYTHYGPVVYDKTFRSERQDVNFALKWTAHMPSNEQRTFLLLNKGKSHSDYIEALNHFSSPAQNFVFASTSGDIAMKVQGRFPIKWEGQGKYLMDGSDSDFEWQGFIPNEHHASTLNPERGFVSSANQHPTTQNYPYYVFDYSFEHYRNRRLNKELARLNSVTLKDMQALQFDDYYLHAAEALPSMLTLLDEKTADADFAEKYLQLLQDWDFYANPDSEATTLFHVWWDHFFDGMWDNLKNEKAPLYLPNNYQTTELLQQFAQGQVVEGLNRDIKKIINDGFDKMLTEIKEKESANISIQWAYHKNTTIAHLVPNFKSFSQQGLYTGGGKGIINATGERSGASWRYVVEMGPTKTAFGIYPGGQSGNPGSKFYDNFVPLWANGEYVELPLRTKNDTENVLFTTTLKKPL
jgi:penicillin G amidase